MKINKIYIAAFGGIKDFTLELDDGLNVIYGDNEAGKSTVFAFIKAMFFGTGRSAKNLSESIRQKYTPWDNSPMGGRIFFEDKGKNYCLEREFRKSDSTDRILLTDTDLGKSVDFGENVGIKFFGMSTRAFERTLFIGNGGTFAADAETTGEINKKLSNVAITGTEDTSHQKIQKRLLDAKAKIISKTGKAGSYTEDLRAYEDLKIRLAKAEDDAQKKLLLNQKIDEKRTEYETLYKKYLSLKETVDRENDIKNSEKLKEYLETKKQLDALNENLRLADGTVLDETYIKKISFGINKYEKYNERCGELEKETENLKKSIELQKQNSPEDAKKQIEVLKGDILKLSEQKDNFLSKEQTCEQQINSYEQKLDLLQSKTQKINPLFLILSLIFVCLTAVCVPVSHNLGITPVISAVIGFCAIVFFVLSLVLKPTNKSQIIDTQQKIAEQKGLLADTKEERNQIQEKINSASADINTLSSLLNNDTAVLAQKENDLKDKISALSETQQKKDETLNEIKTYLPKSENFNTIDEIKDFLQKLENSSQTQKNLKLTLSYLSRDLGNISYEKATEKLADMQNRDMPDADAVEKAKTDYENASERLSILKEEITVCITELKTAFRHTENPEDITRELNSVKEKLTAKKEFCDKIDIVLNVLQESYGEIRSGFGSELEKQTQNIFNSLTGGKYSSVTVSDNFEMSVEQSGIFGTRDLDYLSLGTTHQAYLSLRLAIAKLICGDNTLPVFLDDSLSQYDDVRTENAMKFLKEFCTNSQGIFFTCHNSVCETAQNLGITALKPYN